MIGRRAASVGLMFVSLIAPKVSSAATPGGPLHTASPSDRPSRQRSRPSSLREKRILEARNGILRELGDSGFKSWDEWSASLEPFRKAYRERVSAARPFNPEAPGHSEARTEVIGSRGEPPLFESWPSNYLRYLMNPVTSTSAFMTQTAFVDSIDTISRWLASKNIDLIFVPVPKLTEVYPDHFFDETPPQRIVAPQMRRAFFELLDRGVEVVDLLPAMLESRKNGGPLLYQHCDPHWTPEGQKLGLDMIVERLRRYPVVRKAMLGPPLFRSKTDRMDVSIFSGAFEALTPAQRERVRPLLVHDIETAVPLGKTQLTSDDSPVLLAGDSFNNGLVPRLAERINLPIRDVHAAGGTTQAFKDLLRDEESMKSLRVVIYLVCNPGLYQFPASLPAAIAKFSTDTNQK